MTRLQNVRRVGIDARGMQPKSTGLGNYIRNVLVPLAADNPAVDFLLYSNIALEAPTGANIHARQSERYQAAPRWMHVSLPRLLANDRIDVFWGAIGYVPVLTCPCPTVVTIHDFVYRFAPQTMNRLTRWNRAIFQTLSGRRATKLVAISKATASDAEQIFGRSADAIIPPAISPDYRLQSEREIERVCALHHIPGPYFLCVGTLEPRKNVQMMLGAYVQARRAGAVLPDLVLAGSVGWKQGPFDAAGAPPAQGGQVRYLGYVEQDDLPPLYAGATALLMPSVYEGFGMPVLEAQRCGASVVHGAHASMVEAGGGLGVAVDSEPTSWRQVFERFERGELPLVCRLPADSLVEADSAQLMAEVINLCSAGSRR